MQVYELAKEHLLKRIDESLEKIDEESIEAMIELLLKCVKNGRRVFLIGAGRSGLVAKALGMRLVHLGFEPYIVGETITRPLQEGDLMIAISGSGRTTSVVSVASKAKELGGNIVLITYNEDSPLAEIADVLIKLEGKRSEDDENDYLARQLEYKKAPIAPLGTLFELSALIFLDSIVSELAHRLGMDEQDMKIRHTNLE